MGLGLASFVTGLGNGYMSAQDKARRQKIEDDTSEFVQSQRARTLAQQKLEDERAALVRGGDKVAAEAIQGLNSATRTSIVPTDPNAQMAQPAPAPGLASGTMAPPTESAAPVPLGPSGNDPYSSMTPIPATGDGAAPAPVSAPTPAAAPAPAPAPGLATVRTAQPAGAQPGAPLGLASSTQAAMGTGGKAGMANTEVPDPKVLVALNAKTQYFLDKGLLPEYQQTWAQAAQVRAAMRAGAFAQADKEYAITQDPTVYAKNVYPLIDDGHDYVGSQVVKGADGKPVMALTRRDQSTGEEQTVNMPVDQFMRTVALARNPAAVMGMEAERAAAEFKTAQQMKIDAAKADAEGRNKLAEAAVKADASKLAPGFQWNADHTAQVRIPGGPADDTSQPITGDAIANAAARYNIDGTLPPMGMGKDAAKQRAAILNKAAELAAAAGVGPDDQRINQLGNAATKAAWTQLSKQQAMVGAYEKNFNKNADIALELSDKVDRTGVPMLNKWIQAGKRSVGGDPDLSAYDQAIKSVVNEYSKIISGSMGNTATAEGEIKKVESLLNAAQTPDQVKSVVGLMKRETQNRMAGFDEQKQELVNSLRGKSPPAPAAPAAPPAALPRPANAADFAKLPSGTVYVAPDGSTRRKP